MCMKADDVNIQKVVESASLRDGLDRALSDFSAWPKKMAKKMGPRFESAATR